MAVHRAVQDRERSTSLEAGGRGKASLQDTSSWLGTSPALLVPCRHPHRSIPSTPPGCRSCSCQPCPALLQRQGLPNRRGTAQLSSAPLASPMCAALGSQGRDILTSAWPPGVSVLLQRSQRRQGRCQSFPSEVTFSARAGTRREGHASPPAHMPRGSMPLGDITSAYKILKQLWAPQPPVSLPPLCCLAGDRGYLGTAIKPMPPTWEVTAGDMMQMKPCTQELLQEDPSLQAPQAHPSVPPTPSLSQNPPPAPLLCHPGACTHCLLATLPK